MEAFLSCVKDELKNLGQNRSHIFVSTQWLSSLELCISHGYSDLAMTEHYIPRKICRHFKTESRRLPHNGVYGTVNHTPVSYIVQCSPLSADALKMLLLQKDLWCRTGTELHRAVQPVGLMG